MQAKGSIVKRLFCILCVGMALFINSGVDVFADEGGQLLSDPIGDIGSDVPTSVVDNKGEPVAHYNYLIPYNVKCIDVGGYATGVQFTPDCKYKWWSSYIDHNAWQEHISKASNVGQNFNVEWDGETVSNSYVSNGTWKIGTTYQIQTDSNTGVNYIEANGLKAYVCAVPLAFFNFKPADGNFMEPGTVISKGILFDMILKDGTVIHFVAGDAAGLQHTNGGEFDENGNRVTGHDGLHLTYAPMKTGADKYRNLFHAAIHYHTFELWGKQGATSRFKSYYGIDSNPVVAVRIYNTCLTNNNFQAANGMGELSVKGGVPNLSGGNGLTGQTQGYTKGYYDESDLAAWSYLNGESVIDFSDRSDLEQSDLTDLYNWENNIKSNKFSFTRLIRYIISFMGIMFITWGSFFYLGYWFDRINPIIPVRMVNFLSFGKLEVAPDENECTYKLTGSGKGTMRTINHAAALEIALTAVAFGTLIITGWAYKFIAWLIRFVTSRIF